MVVNNNIYLYNYFILIMVIFLLKVINLELKEINISINFTGCTKSFSLNPL